MQRPGFLPVTVMPSRHTSSLLDGKWQRPIGLHSGSGGQTGGLHTGAHTGAHTGLHTGAHTGGHTGAHTGGHTGAHTGGGGHTGLTGSQFGW